MTAKEFFGTMANLKISPRRSHKKQKNEVEERKIRRE